MNPDCYPVEEIGNLIDLDPRDPRLAHVRECVRCRNLLVSMRAFRDPMPEPDGADRGEAETHMNRFMENELAADIQPGPPREAGILQFLIPVRQFLLRPVTSLAIVFLAVVIIFSINQHNTRQGPFVVRGTDTSAAPQMILNPPQVQTDGSVLLSWSPLDAAEAYDVIILSSTLDELSRITAGADTFMTISSASIPGLTATNSRILWQVQSLCNNGETIQSLPAGLDLF
jgi:hypothetical protein